MKNVIVTYLSTLVVLIGLTCFVIGTFKQCTVSQTLIENVVNK